MFSQIVTNKPFYVKLLDHWTRYKNDHIMYACITFVRWQQHAYNWHIVDVVERETAVLQGDAHVFDCL